MMRTKRFLFSALLILTLIIAGCGVPDIDEVDQASLKSFVLSNTVPPNKPTNVEVVAGQSYATAFDTATNVPIVRLPNNLYGVQFNLAADRELVAVSDVVLTGSTPLTPYFHYSNGDFNYLYEYADFFMDDNYHFVINRINSRVGTAELEFALDTPLYFHEYVDVKTADTTTQYNKTLIALDDPANPQVVDVVYEYSTHYDGDASNADYDPIILDGVPPLITWEEPAKTSDPQAGSPIGYRIFRNYPQGVLSASSTASTWSALTGFDGRTFTATAGSSINVDTRDKTWVHTTDFYGNDTQLTTSAVPRQNWEGKYSYRVATVNEYGNTSEWTAPVSVRTVPPKAIPVMIKINADSNSNSSFVISWSYSKDLVDIDNLDYFLLYASYLPPRSIDDIQKIPANLKLGEERFLLGYNDGEEEYKVNETLQGWLQYIDGMNSSTNVVQQIPRFVWIQAVDIWGNSSRRSFSMCYRPASDEFLFTNRVVLE